MSYEDRVFNIELCEQYDIPCVLYMKPFLPNITAKDLPKYMVLVQKYQLLVVVEISRKILMDIASVVDYNNKKTLHSE